MSKLVPEKYKLPYDDVPLKWVRLTKQARVILREVAEHGDKWTFKRFNIAIELLEDYGLVQTGNMRARRGPRGGISGGDPYIKINERGVRWLKSHDRWRTKDEEIT